MSCRVDTQEQHIEDEDQDVQGPPPLRASRHWGEEKRCASQYGVGYKLLNKMGWRAESELCVLRQEEKRDRAGIGYHARLNVLDASIDQKLLQVHNDNVGHVGKLRTYRRLRMLEGFPWVYLGRSLVVFSPWPSAGSGRKIPNQIPNVGRIHFFLLTDFR